MEHHVSTSQIILNVVVQLINIGLFFFLFIKFVGKPITKILVERVAQEKKLAAAEQAYTTRIDEANVLSTSIVAEANAHKDMLVRQSELTAKQKWQEILDEAKRKAAVIEDNANKQAKLMRAQMEQKFTQAVSSSVHIIVDKLFEQKDAHASYVDKLVTEFTTSADAEKKLA
jgi:F0F1-type ATP synthase membrane subunit b/b'